jgi:hypothetical protein
VLLLEVMDKMPSAPRLMAIGVGVGALGFAIVRRWRWTVLPVLALAATLAWSRVAIYTDAYLGPAVWRESGFPYALAVGVSAVAALGLPLVALGTRKPAADSTANNG